jgi:hypothetical protein
MYSLPTISHKDRTTGSKTVARPFRWSAGRFEVASLGLTVDMSVMNELPIRLV